MKHFVFLMFTALLLGCASQSPVVLPPSSENAALPTYKLVAAHLPGNTQEFVSYELQHVDAILVNVNWSQIETTAPVNGVHKYDFTSADAVVAQWTTRGKQVALIVSLNSDGTPTDVALPAYVTTAAWATQCCKSKALTTVSCSDSGFPYKGMPDMLQAPFNAAAYPFLKAALAHFSDPAKFVYIRTGTSGGGNNPTCNQLWPGFTNAAFLVYLKNFGQYLASVKSSVLVAMTSSSSLGDPIADTEYSYWHSDGFASGIEMLGANSDTYPCIGDWCKNFKLYPGDYHFLQAAAHQPLGALSSYVPFALSYGTKSLEIWEQDLSVAYDPHNANYTKYGPSYRAALGK